jgi:hypothetical protein
MGTKWSVANEEFRVFKDETTTLLYLVQAGAVFKVSANHVSVRTCGDRQSWLECLRESRNSIGASSATELLLGKIKSAPPVSRESVCSFSLSVPESRREWAPSPPGDRKREILQALSSEMTRAARYFGKVRSIVCNNFNVDDPEVWGLAEITDKTGEMDHLLIGVHISGTSPIQVTASFMRCPADNDGPLIRKIQRDVLDVPISGLNP